MKRLLFSMTVISLCLLSWCAASQAEMCFTFPDATGLAGTQVQIPLQVTGATAFDDYQCEVRYPADKLRYESLVNTAWSSVLGTPLVNPNTAGVIRATAAAISPVAAGSGDLFILTFTLIGTGGQEAVVEMANMMVNEQMMTCLTDGTVTIDQAATTVLKYFSATATPSNVQLKWATGSEIDLSGFHVWHKLKGQADYERITDALIPARATTAKGAVYSLVDSDIINRARAYYMLEEVGTGGESTYHGPNSAVPSDVGIVLTAPGNGLGVPSLAPIAFKWRSSAYSWFKLQFCKTSTFKTGVLTLPPTQDGQEMWIQGFTFTPNNSQWTKIKTLTTRGKRIYWRAYGKNVSGECYLGKAGWFTIK